MFVLRDLKTKEVCNEGAVHYEEFQDALKARAKMARSKSHYVSPFSKEDNAVVCSGGDLVYDKNRLRGINELFDEVFDSTLLNTKSVDLELKEIFQVLGMNDAKLKDLI
tara:strand:+ start:2790 stop:3116 length:327 start_codon:yes stop_codon:yes gene_type:complete